MTTRALPAVLVLLTLAACGPGPTTLPDPPTVGAPSSAVKSAAVPNVVGMDHQAAQDAMQKAGFYYLTEEDSTGQGRQLVNDSNWVVVAQVPAAGEVVPQSDKILLRSKKKTDSAASAPSSSTAKTAAVPNVVGVDHQDAQNALQKAGFYYLTEEDATGQGRQLVVDHNWVVVEQIPAAGKVVPQSDKILLRSKKKTDP
ncbi:PASTA domain-containing protein [Actinokineospora diospyrosa]|uniref:PASTA domain-containing protein n=1 Tax=Actinokineospora diospyrosa TaxID=103728 RepID=A0ABT1IDT6_9PSEU|nr:PASTA domain-containing protein [Actinokineospora diospyrosa]MCP2270526.1 PASTA domain-containing protein [Actinokineospora diospyrosa]